MARRSGATVRFCLHLAERRAEDCPEAGYEGLSAEVSLSLSSLKCAELLRAAALRCCFSWGRAWPGVLAASGSRLCAQTGGVCTLRCLHRASQVNEKWGGQGGGRERGSS